MHGQTKFNYPKLFRFAFDGISSFSIVPLKIATYLGVLIACIAIGIGLGGVIASHWGWRSVTGPIAGWCGSVPARQASQPVSSPRLKRPRCSLTMTC